MSAMMVDRSIPHHITGLYLFTVFNVIALLNISLVSGDVEVTNLQQNETLADYNDAEAQFGPSVPHNGIMGRLVYVIPHNACSEVEPPPVTGETDIVWIALIAREGCEFGKKVLNAQKANYRLAIVQNRVGDDDLVRMGGGKYGRDVQIPSVFVGYTDGKELSERYNYKHKKYLVNVVSNIQPIDYRIYLWPFVIVVGTCFVLMVIFMIAKWCRDINTRRRSRLSQKHLKKIPIKKFKKGDHYDMCAICLDDYEEGEKMRILPCSHAYHVKCIDPWLTKNKKTCPVCKRRVIPGEDNDSDSDSDEENGNTTQPTEATPLLGGGQRPGSSRRSTFDTSGLPETVREEVTRVNQAGPSENEAVSGGSHEGAVGGEDSGSESVEIVVEVENASNINYGFSDDSDVSVKTGADAKKEMNQGDKISDSWV